MRDMLISTSFWVCRTPPLIVYIMCLQQFFKLFWNTVCIACLLCCMYGNCLPNFNFSDEVIILTGQSLWRFKPFCMHMVRPSYTGTMIPLMTNHLQRDHPVLVLRPLSNMCIDPFETIWLDFFFFWITCISTPRDPQPPTPPFQSIWFDFFLLQSNMYINPYHFGWIFFFFRITCISTPMDHPSFQSYFKLIQGGRLSG